MIVLYMLFGLIIGAVVGGIIVYAVTSEKNDENIRNAYIAGYTVGTLEELRKGKDE